MPLGQGELDWKPIMDFLPQMDLVRWVMVEQDKTTGDPKADIAASRRFLRDTFGY